MQNVEDVTNQSLALTQDGLLALQHLAQDLRYVGGELGQQDLLAILFSAAKEAGSASVQTKVSTAKNIVSFAQNTFERYRTEGWEKATREDWARLRGFAESMPERVRDTIGTFSSLSREKQIEQASILVLTILVFYLTAGGYDLEGGLPDLDLELGIGAHRNPFSHSLLCGFGAEFTIRFVTVLLDKGYQHLPPDHHPTWDHIHSFMMANHHLVVGAMWAGIGAHLIKDANWFADRTKPYTWLHGSYSMSTHQTIFMANGLASEAVAVGEVAVLTPALKGLVAPEQNGDHADRRG